MLAVALSAAAMAPWLARFRGLEIAAYNADDAVTVAGDLSEIDALAAALEDTWCGRVRVEVAYHSAQMDPIGPRLRAALAGISPRTPHTRLVSTVTGAEVAGPVHDAAYWWRNTRGAVRLADALRTALGVGVDAVLEVGPHPVLAPSVQAVSGGRASTLHALRRQAPEEATLDRAVVALYAARP
jgi:acyl transferase domain-containing protein